MDPTQLVAITNQTLNDGLPEAGWTYMRTLMFPDGSGRVMFQRRSDSMWAEDQGGGIGWSVSHTPTIGDFNCAFTVGPNGTIRSERGTAVRIYGAA